MRHALARSVLLLLAIAEGAAAQPPAAAPQSATTPSESAPPSAGRDTQPGGDPGAETPPSAAPPSATPTHARTPRDAPAVQQNVVVLNRSEREIDSIEAEDDGALNETTLHGFRLGYGVWFNYDEPEAGDESETSPKQRLGLSSPHHFLLGYELAERMPAGNDALNILLVGNLMVGGLEQSKFLPNLNLLLGFELQRALQLGVGINLAPVEHKPAHMVLAAGWTPRSGDLYLPVHAFFVPDVDGHHRMGFTFGVNWDT